MNGFQSARSRVSIVCLAVLLILGNTVQVQSLPLLPHTVGGVLLVDGHVVGTTRLRATVDGLEFETITQPSGQYGILIPSDDLDTSPEIEGGTEGALVGFQVDGVEIVESLAWTSGAITALNLTNGPLTSTITQAVPAGVTTVYTMANGQVGVTILPAGSGLGNTAVEVQANQVCEAVSGQAVARCFQITPDVVQPATLTFTFFQNQIPGGQTCQNLKVLRRDGTSWTNLGGAANCAATPFPVPHTITVSGVDRFGQFIIQAAGVPTPTPTPTPTPVASSTATATVMPSATPTATPVTSGTSTPTPSPTSSPTATPTPTPTATPTHTPVTPGASTHTPTSSPTSSLITTPTLTSTATPTHTPVTPGASTHTPTSSPTSSPITTPTLTSTATPTATPVTPGGAAHTHTHTHTPTPTPSPTSSPTATPTATPTAPDVDTDDVADAVEDGVPNPDGSGTGDGNGDGIPDSEQADVASLPNAVDGGYLTLVSNNGSALQSVRIVSPTMTIPAGLTLPYGLLSFTVSGLAAGEHYSATLILHTGSSPTDYWKYGPTADNSTDHWYSFHYDGETGAFIEGNRVTLYFVDGRRGDGDLSANGVIPDPGAPAQRAIYRVWLSYLAGLPPGEPDLIVDRLSVWSDGVEIVIKNVGQAAVTDEFWVDVYLAPAVPPSAVNQLWNDLGSQGLVWGVTGDALPIPPGGSVSLTLGDRYYSPAHSHVAGELAPGTPVYAQADSWNQATAYGAVLEGHEVSGGVYNNIVRADAISAPPSEDLQTSPQWPDFSSLPVRP